MFKKMGHSQSTMLSTCNNSYPIAQKIGQTAIKDPQIAKYPLKLPQGRLRRETEITTSSQTIQNPETRGIKIFKEANKSQVFQAEQNSKVSLQQYPQYQFTTKTSRPLSKVSTFSHLNINSNQISQKSLDNISPNIETSRIEKETTSKIHHSDPIANTHSDQRHNSQLEKSWQEPRRHRDNGKKCQQTLKWEPTYQPRPIYQPQHIRSKQQISWK